MTEVDAVKVLARSPVAVVSVILCQLGIIILFSMMTMSALTFRRTQQKSHISEQGNYVQCHVCLFQFRMVLNFKLYVQHLPKFSATFFIFVYFYEFSDYSIKKLAILKYTVILHECLTASYVLNKKETLGAAPLLFFVRVT